MGSVEIADLPQDMTKEEKEVVLDFIANGLPGVQKIQQSDSFQAFRLYMTGKTYAEIAVISKISKTFILYLAYKSNWMELRFKHYQDISLNILDKIQKAKLDIANDLLVITAATGKYIRDEYNRYLSTNDKSIIESMDQKIVSSYYKATDILDNVLNEDKNSDPDKKPKGPLVNINVGMGAKASIEQTGPESLEITDETAGELVKALASMKKLAEAK